MHGSPAGIKKRTVLKKKGTLKHWWSLISLYNMFYFDK
jgi:hypothetical protein